MTEKSLVNGQGQGNPDFIMSAATSAHETTQTTQHSDDIMRGLEAFQPHLRHYSLQAEL